MKKQVTLPFILSVKWLMKYLIVVLEISLKDALAINSAYELGDKIKFEEAPAEFGRVAAQSAKQTIMEK